MKGGRQENESSVAVPHLPAVVLMVGTELVWHISPVQSKKVYVGTVSRAIDLVTPMRVNSHGE